MGMNGDKGIERTRLRRMAQIPISPCIPISPFESSALSALSAVIILVLTLSEHEMLDATYRPGGWR
jgi:hypothetical protein